MIRAIAGRLLPPGSRFRGFAKTILHSAWAAGNLARASTFAGPAPRFHMRWYVGPQTGRSVVYRVDYYAKAFRALGVRTSIYRNFDFQATWSRAIPDVAILFRANMTPHLRSFIAWHRARGVPLLMDMDDLLFDESNARRDLPWLEGLPASSQADLLRHIAGFRDTIHICDGFVATTASLAEAAPLRDDQPAFVLPNPIPFELLDPVAGTRLSGAERTCLGYFSGSPTHDQDWALIEDAVHEVMSRHPQTDLLLVGPVRCRLLERHHPGRVIRRPLVPFSRMARWLAGVDINLCPLQIGNRFCEAKSEIKITEAAALGVPSVASGTRTFRSCIAHARNGMLADTSADWVAALDRLCQEPGFHRELGAAAQTEISFRYHPFALAAGAMPFYRTRRFGRAAGPLRPA